MKRTQTLSMILMLTAASGLAIAAPEKKNNENKDVLRGPDVVDTSTPQNKTDEKPAMGDPELEPVDFEKNPIELREYTIAIRSLNGPQADSTLSMTPEQSQQLRDILQNYREDLRAFQEANQVEIRKLRDAMNKEARERREQQEESADEQKDAMQGQTGRASPSPRAEGDAARKLREFIASSPAAKTAIKQINAVLTPEQMEAVKQNVEKMRQRASQSGRDGARPGQRGNGTERGPARRGVDNDSDQVRPAQRRDRDAQRDKSDKPADD